MPYADLHVHTTRSDGSLSLEGVPAAARRAGVDVVALTDHDRLQPFDGPAIERDGVVILGGVELRVEIADGSTDDGARIDLLGYGVESTADLEAELETIQRDRRERGRAIVDCVEDRLGIDLDAAIERGFGRPHVARAVADHPDAPYDYQGAFDELIGDDQPCYRPRQVPSFERGRRLLDEAADLVSLAHPLRYREPERALERATALDAVEVYYPYERDVDRAAVERFVDREDLLATGGSDVHDERLGVAGLSEASYRALGLSAG